MIPINTLRAGRCISIKTQCYVLEKQKIKMSESFLKQTNDPSLLDMAASIPRPCFSLEKTLWNINIHSSECTIILKRWKSYLSIMLWFDLLAPADKNRVPEVFVGRSRCRWLLWKSIGFWLRGSAGVGPRCINTSAIWWNGVTEWKYSSGLQNTEMILIWFLEGSCRSFGPVETFCFYRKSISKAFLHSKPLYKK